METLNYLREYASGFRMPDLSKIWYGQDLVDGVDSGDNESLLIQIEYYLVKVQELALWTDPKSSAIALGVVHLFFAYLSVTSNTTFNLVLWTILAGFLYITWTQRIWPEIRVDVAKPSNNPLEYSNPDVFTASELQDIMVVISGKANRGYTRLVEMRRETPGKFCFVMCTSLVIIAYIGSYISAFCLFYYITVGGLVVPGSLKYIIMNYPPAQEAFENLRILEELKRKKSTKKKEVKQDDVDGVVSGMNVDIRGAADKVQSLVQNVCSTLQTGVSSLTSTLPDLQQLEKQHKELKEGTSEDIEDDDTMDNENGATSTDDLAPYLPDVNSIESSQLLETCVTNFELEQKDPTEVKAFENDDNHDSMLDCSIAGIDRSAMPDHEELDSLPSINLETTQREEVTSSTTSTKSILLSSVCQPDDEFDEPNKEFLPEALVSKQSARSNVSTDEFDLDDDSRQLSIDQSFPESRQSDNDSIPYDNHELEVRAAMEELIDEDILSRKDVRVGEEVNSPSVQELDIQVRKEAIEPTKVPLEKSKSKESSPSDDNVEDDFEVISAEDLS